MDQSQIRGESLVAVLIIKEEDREECWQNYGTLLYDLRTPDTTHGSHLPLIGTMTTDPKTAIVLSCYENITLNGVGMRMELIGPGDKPRLWDI